MMLVCFDKKSTVISAKISGTVLRELAEHIGLLYVATDTVSHGRLPSALEKIAVGHIVEAIDTISDQRTSLERTLLENGELSVTLADVLYHHERSVVVVEVHAGPVVVDLLVHPADEIRERHVLLENFDSGFFIHRETILAHKIKKVKLLCEER